MAVVLVVAIDPKTRPFVKDFLKNMWPQFGYGLLSVVILSWLIYRDFQPLGGLGSELMREAKLTYNLTAWLGAPIMGLLDYIILYVLCAAVAVFWFWFYLEFFAQWVLVKGLFVNAGQALWRWREYPIRFVQFKLTYNLTAWLGAPIMGLLDYIILYVLCAAVAVFWFWFYLEFFAQWVLVKGLFVNAGQALWRWREYPIRFVQFVVDLFVHPPSVKDIRETLRSTLPQEEKIRKVSMALREEYEAVVKQKMAGWKRASFGRQHNALADEIAARRAKAMTAYHQGIAATARTLRESAEAETKMSAEGERDEHR